MKVGEIWTLKSKPHLELIKYAKVANATMHMITVEIIAIKEDWVYFADTVGEMKFKWTRKNFLVAYQKIYDEMLTEYLPT